MRLNTEQLIDALSRGVRPVSRHAVAKRVVFGIAAGGLVAMILVTAALGIRPDLGFAMQGFSFWMKWTYTASLGVAALYAITRLARPIPVALRGLWLLAVPALVLAGIGLGELARTPSSEWLAIWLGTSWMHCSWRVLSLAAPVFAGLLWSFKRFAPTHLSAAGAVAGLAAGAWAAAVYCLHCPEVSAIFVLTWYSLGIALAAGIGALLGPRLLRW
jgi:hypothetical protein